MDSFILIAFLPSTIPSLVLGITKGTLKKKRNLQKIIPRKKYSQGNRFTEDREGVKAHSARIISQTKFCLRYFQLDPMGNYDT